MASLFKLHKLFQPLVLNNRGIATTIVKPKLYLHRDWKPGPYPKTEEERKKAAEKYGLSPEEYEPYPDDGDGHGDYPKLPEIGRAARDPYYPWDDPTFRRNLNEPLHANDTYLGEDRWDAGLKPPVSYGAAAKYMFVFFGGITFCIWLAEPYKFFHHVMEKQIPKPGAVHYTFEPAR